jgi:hypothetical protein
MCASRGGESSASATEIATLEGAPTAASSETLRASGVVGDPEI